MECTHCPLRASCQAPCAAIEAQLPQDWFGDWPQLRRFVRGRFLQNLLAQRRAVALMIEHREILKGRLRQVFDMTHNEGLSQAQISRQLGVQRRVVTTYLKRAYAMLAKAVRGLRPRQREGKVR
ncbi:MAG: hypothetical protein IT462_17835 [Planctomycetes bacterium]|nr:hypothetical protein [Planctomycetota bacterium]